MTRTALFVLSIMAIVSFWLLTYRHMTKLRKSGRKAMADVLEVRYLGQIESGVQVGLGLRMHGEDKRMLSTVTTADSKDSFKVGQCVTVHINESDLNDVVVDEPGRTYR